MQPWRPHFVLGTLVLAIAMVACGGSTPGVETSHTSVTIESCTTTTSGAADIQAGQISFTYNGAPSRAITLNQHATEVLLALGLADAIAGTAYTDDQVLQEYQAAYDSIPVLAEKYPSKEVILAQEPDFIYAGFSSAFSDDAAGSQEDLKKLGIGSYLTTAVCNESADSLTDVYTDIRNIGKIFRVSDAAEALVTAMEREVTEIRSELDYSERPTRVFLYDSGDEAPYTAACCSMFTSLIETIGGANIFDDIDGRWSTVNWEEVIVRDPEVIVLTEAVWSTAQDKIDLLLSNLAYADITAVKERRFVVLQFSSIVPGIRNPAAIRNLAEGIYPDQFP